MSLGTRRPASRKAPLALVLAVFVALAVVGAAAAFTLRNKSGTRRPAPAAGGRKKQALPYRIFTCTMHCDGEPAARLKLDARPVA